MSSTRYAYQSSHGDYGRRLAIRLVVRLDEGVFVIDYDDDLKARHVESDPDKTVLAAARELSISSGGDFVAAVNYLRNIGGALYEKGILSREVRS